MGSTDSLVQVKDQMDGIAQGEETGAGTPS